MKAYILKKDLPTIRAGRVIRLNADGKFGSPSLMSVEMHDTIQYIFPIRVLEQETEWFEEFENGVGMPTMVE